MGQGYLQKKVIELDRELKVEALTAAAKKAMQSDDWPRTLDFFQQAKKIQPDNQHATDGYALALRMLSLRREIQAHLDAPQRLSSMNVAESVVALIRKADTLSGLSKSLDASKANLATLLATYSVPVEVTVVSDGVTFVSVRSVGRVGAIKEKLIKLRPGSYLFEGTRPGYKSKLVSVEIPPNVPKVTVEISCDEQI